MTDVMKFYKEFEKYGLIKDSQFILNIPLALLSEIVEKFSQLPQQEISDEEIEKEAEEYSNSFLNRGVAMSSFMRGCYWYREQLKK